MKLKAVEGGDAFFARSRKRLRRESLRVQFHNCLC